MYFFIKHNKLLKKVLFEDISYVRSNGNYCEIFADEKMTVKLSLSRLICSLPDEKFIRVHQRYLINFAKLNSIDLQKNQLYLGKDVLPVGPKFKEELLNRINKLLPLSTKSNLSKCLLSA